MYYLWIGKSLLLKLLVWKVYTTTSLNWRDGTFRDVCNELCQSIFKTEVYIEARAPQLYVTWLINDYFCKQNVTTWISRKMEFNVSCLVLYCSLWAAARIQHCLRIYYTRISHLNDVPEQQTKNRHRKDRTVSKR